MEPFKFIRSLEDLLYEMVISLILFPVTLVRIVLRPVAMMRVIQQESGEADAGHYSDNLNPPLCFLFAIFAAHIAAMPFGASQIAQSGNALARLAMASEENTLLFRAATFLIWPAVGALVWRQVARVALDRNLLRPIFYQQFYLAAPFALLVSFATSTSADFVHANFALVTVLMAAAALWFVAAQARVAQAMLRCGALRSWLTALAILATGGALFIAMMQVAMSV